MTCSLYPYQKQCVAQLLAGKHIVVAGCGCHAKGHPILMADYAIKPVERIKVGDKIMSATGVKTVIELVRGVDTLYRIIPLKGEPFVVNGAHILSLYTNETRMKAIYGEHIFATVEEWASLKPHSKKKHGYKLAYKKYPTRRRPSPTLDAWLIGAWLGDGDNQFSCPRTRFTNIDKPVISRMRELVQARGWSMRQLDCAHWYISSAQKRGRKSFSVLAKELRKLGIFKSPIEKTMPIGYLGWGEEDRLKLLAGMLDTDGSSSEHRKYDFCSRDKDLADGVRLLARSVGLHATMREVQNRYHRVYIGGDIEKIPCVKHYVENRSRANQAGRTGFSIEKLGEGEYYGFVLDGDHLYLDGNLMEHHNCGKTAMALAWAEQKQKETGKTKLCVWTTASKTKTSDWQDEQKIFAPSLSKSLSSLSVISWHKASAWVNQHWGELDEWMFIYDECQRAKSGASSGMGKAFLKATKKTGDWVGLTGTPSDNWLGLYPYLQACDLVRNKTSFMAEFANVQTYKGYPEIVGWRNEDRLHNMWARVSCAPDTSRIYAELPKSVNRPITFSLPKTYATVLKTRMRAGSDGSNYDEDFLDTPGSLCAELRRICFTKDKQEWVSDFIAELGTQAVVFYNFVATGDKLQEICEKALPEGARVWRIDGKHHEIPTAETLGPCDIVLSQWQSGSEGLNFQAIHYELLVELPYSYSTLKQGLGRIRRIGQKNTTFFYTLLCDKGIEQDIKQILKTKGEFALREWCIGKGIN